MLARRPTQPTLLQRLIGLVMMLTMAAAPVVHGAGSCHPGMGTEAMAAMDEMAAGHAHHTGGDAAPASEPATVPDMPRGCCGAPVAVLAFPPARLQLSVHVAPQASPIRAAVDHWPATHHAPQPPSTGPPAVSLSA